MKASTLGSFIGVVLVSLSIHFYLYSPPQKLIWDENYHIASAQRYLSGVFFMEPHPPLGKLFIALGEWLLDRNPLDNQFIGIEKIDEVPDHFSFAGYRFFPTLFGSLIPPLLFLIVFAITVNTPLSSVIGLTAALNNGLIVHNSSAMLEGPQLAFALCALLSYLKTSMSEKSPAKWLIFLGFSSVCSVMVKFNSLPILLLPLALALDRKRWWPIFKFCIVPAVFIFFAIWQVHFALGKQVQASLDNMGYFALPSTLRTTLLRDGGLSVLDLPGAILASFEFFKRYQSGVPALNYCSIGETGSYPLLWPIGAQSILYRWDSDGLFTRYLYLIINPASLFIGFLGVITGGGLLAARAAGLLRSLQLERQMIVCITVYLIAWLSPLGMSRVFYLYHYFLPLCLSWILLAFAARQGLLLQLSKELRRKLLQLGTLVSISALVFCFLLLKPLTFHEPIPSTYFSQLRLPELWNVRCRDCESINPLARPLRESDITPRTDDRWRLSIGSVNSNYIEQSVGEPAQGSTASGFPIVIDGKRFIDGFGVIAPSKIQFPLNGNYTKFAGLVGLPDNHRDGRVRCRVVSDGQTLWSSPLLSVEHPSAPFALSIVGNRSLTLISETEKGLLPTNIVWTSLTLTGSSTTQR